MKRFLFGGLVLLASGVANASTVFMPTDGDVNFFNITLSGGATLAMFDDQDTGFTTPLIISPLPSLVTITGPVSGDYTATNTASASITLTNNNWFSLGVYNASTGWAGDVFSACNSVNACTVQFADGSILSVDTTEAPTVPAPAAIWLLGSGLLGLAGIAKRKTA